MKMKLKDITPMRRTHGRAENKATPPRTALKRAKPSKADVLVDDFFASGMSAAQFFKRKA